MLWNCLFLGLLVLWQVNGDVYLHVPRGSNNRLDGENRERQNANRLFDSQNNDRGGYNVGGDRERREDLRKVFESAKNTKEEGARREAEETQGPPGRMEYYEGSIMQISWTNQHQCSGENAHCELIVQYMCDNNLRDGFERSTIPESNNGCNQGETSNSGDCDTDRRYGMMENNAYYLNCKVRKRNKNLFTADQDLKGNTAKYTRQNPGGTRRGYECPEERDYYPYWHPTPWIDVAVMTNNISRCDAYKLESENVKPRGYCKIPEEVMKRIIQGNGNDNRYRIPNNKGECMRVEFPDFAGKKSEWVQDTSRTKHDPPECILSPASRDNHLGNGPKGFPSTYNWTIPNFPHKHCALRMRYNISSLEYNWATNKRMNSPNRNKNTNSDDSECPPRLDIAGVIGAPNVEEAEDRGFQFKDNPKVQPFKMEVDGFDLGEKLKLQLAINTAQIGRTFEDRSHDFMIKKRPEKLKDKKIYNMEVQGKRGNIVQVYPAVEYDYGPNRLEVEKDEHVHIQWTGSDRNPQNNDGNGKKGTDRSNMALLKKQNYPEGKPGMAVPINKNGHWGNSYPAHLTDKETLLGLDQKTREYLATTGAKDSELDDAHPYFNLEPQPLSNIGTYHYMCTRNNDFSNRSQKGKIMILQKGKKKMSDNEVKDVKSVKSMYVESF